MLTASSYDIRYVALTESSGAAQRLERLRDDFNSCSTLACKGQPLNSGLTENILATLGLGDDSKLFMVALKVFDDVGHSSDLSNIVIINFQREKTTTNPPATTPLPPLASATTIVVSTSSEKHSLKLSLVQLILIICAAVAVPTLLFVCILCLVLRCKKSARGHHHQSSDVELRGAAEESGIKPDVTRRPEPDGQVSNKYDDVEKRISRRMINRFSRFVRNNRPSGVYETTIVSASDSGQVTSDNQPPAGISNDFADRIGPEGCFPATSYLRPVRHYARSPSHNPVEQSHVAGTHTTEPNARTFVQNPVGSLDRITPPQPVGYNDRMFTPNPEGNVDRTKQHHPIGTDARTFATNPVRTIDRLIVPHPTGNTRARTFDRTPALSFAGVEAIPENNSTSSDDYDDVVVARRSSSGSDYQDNVVAPSASLGERKPPVGADKDTDNPESPPQIPLRQSKTNQPRDSWAIERSSLYQQIGADDTSGYRTGQVAPNMGVFASPASSRFMQPLDPSPQLRDWSSFPTSRPR